MECNMNQGVHVDIGMNLIVYISMCLDEFNFLLIYLIYFVYYVKNIIHWKKAIFLESYTFFL